MASLIFKDSEAAKDAIMDSQKKEIAALYESWADEIGERAKFYSHKINASAPVSERYFKELQKQLKATSQEISNEVYSKIKKNIYTVADAVVADNVKWLESFGFNSECINAAFSYVPDEIVRNLITGQIYDSGWSLSSKIWGDNDQTLKDIYQVMARGLAENKPIYAIAKDLEAYIRPEVRLPWNLRMGDGKKIYKKQVDYSAQRLARTLVQHGYQQSFIATTQKNPFITEYVWRSNGSRVCQLCKDRDGVHFKKDELPMDHPNGMCTMEPVVVDNMTDQLVDWFNSPDGTYPEIDEFAGNFGYQTTKTGTVQDFIDKYGKSSKSPSSWFNSLSPTQKAEAKALKEQSGLTWNKWYEQNIYDGDGISTAKVTTKATDSLHEALIKAQKKLDAITNKTYSGIWKEDVTLADYQAKEASIKKKKKYYNEQIQKYSSPVYENYSWVPGEIDKFEKLLAELDDFEKQGKLYAKAMSEVNNAKIAINKSKGFTSKFDPDSYTDEAKAAAKSFTSATKADEFHRPYLDSIWGKGTDKEHYAVWEYTQNSNPINKSLSGYHDDWYRSSFKGLGNTDLGHEDSWRYFDTSTFEKKFGVDGHKDYKSVVKNLTNMIEKSEMPDSVYLVRGSDKNGLAGLLEGDLVSFDDAVSLLRKGDESTLKALLEGQTFTSHSYLSTGIAEGTGFSGDVKYKIFAPKGTKAIYAEPASYYGDTVGSKEKLYKAGQSYNSIGHEAEVIIQRGTDFRITNVTADKYGDITIDMEVVNQPDYFKTGLEHTHNGGKTSYKK